MNPFFTIVIPTYNRAELLKTTLNSLINQTFQNFECLIVDDGGNDNTKELIANLNDNRFIYHWKINEERGAARNFGLQFAQGSYVIYLDSDDYFKSEHLERARYFISENNTPPIFFHYYDVCNENGLLKTVIHNKINVLESICYRNTLCPSCAIIRIDIARKNPFLKDRKFILAEDLYIWLRIGLEFPLLINSVNTVILTNHQNRSMNLPRVESIEYGVKVITEELENKFTENNLTFLLKRLRANHNSLKSLVYSIKKEYKNSMYWLFMAIKENPNELISKRTLAIFKHLIIPK